MLLGRCPRCQRAPIFKALPAGLWAMNEVCPVCGLRFERESGYFLGAMYVSYGLAVLTILPVSMFLAIVLRWPLALVMTIMIVQTLISMPIFFRYSRVLWLYFDRAVDPEAG